MLLHLLDRLAFRASEQVIGVIAFVAVEFSARKLDHARRDAIEKITIVRHEKAGAGIARQEILEPFDRSGVEMVRRLVEDQKIGPGEQARQSATRRFSPPERLATIRSGSGA